MERATVVLDIGKTNSKLTLWDHRGILLARRERKNESVSARHYRCLDVEGIEPWLLATLREFAGLADIREIIPAAHGAAAALVLDGELFAPPLDYEDEGPSDERNSYDRLRDDFLVTGSPALPQGLNLGFQLYRLETLTGPWPDGLQILPWPQFWAWRLCGVAASELTSLGCHTDLWEPYQNGPSRLSLDRHWARRFGELRYAGDALGQITEHWAEQTGLTRECRVLCGLHDSNAALLAARGHPVVGRHDATVLSTGTWFVAMRSPSQQLAWQRPPALNERRDCLVNVDVSGWPTPSARFMGGREAELIAGLDSFDVADDDDPDALIQRAQALMQAGVFLLPSFVAGVGPFPDLVGRWINEPHDQADRRTMLGLYLALMSDAALELIGSREMLIVEGRFAEAQVFVRALATLRPEQQVFVSNARDEVSYGALRLINPHLAPPAPLVKVEPLAFPLGAYRARWCEALEGALA